MAASRMPVLVLLGLAATCAGQDPLADVPQETSGPRQAARPVGPEDREWERARAEFVEARNEFAAATAAALTSEEMARFVRGLSVRVRLRWAEEDLAEVRASQRAAEASGQGGTERAGRLAEQAAVLEVEVERLRRPDAAAEAQAVAAGMPDRETIRRWVEREMAEETARLADTLDTRELEKRTRRLHTLAGLARLADGLRRRRGEPVPVEHEQAPAVLPAAGAAEPEAAPEEESLGPATTVPPTLSERVPVSQGAGPDVPATGSVPNNSETSPRE